MEQAGPPASMSWVLDDLVRRVDGVTQAGVLSPDGLTLRGSPGRRGPAWGLFALGLGVGSAQVEPGRLGPEHKSLLSLCRSPVTVADLASEIDLPLGVVRVLLGDLREGGLISVVGPRSEP